MFAVIKTGGKQYIVSEGDEVRFEKLLGEVGESVSFGEVLLLADDEKKTVKLGDPMIAKASVTGTILEQGKGKKITIIKYKPKVRYRRKAGHRQPFTKVQIGKIAA